MSLNLPNPWTRELWNITLQGAFLRKHGKAQAEQYARAAGVELGATKPAPEAPPPKIERRSYIFQKRIDVSGADGRGYSGDGPPGEEV